MGKNLEAPAGRSLGVDRDRDALAAELLGTLAHEIGPRDRSRVDRDLVGAGAQQLGHILDRAHPTANGQRHETLLGGALDYVEQRGAVFGRRGDVEETKLVGTLAVINARL